MARPALASAGALILALCACSPEPASQKACDGSATDGAGLQHKLDACDDIIRAGAGGDALERALRAQGAAYRGLGDRARALQSLDHALSLKGDDAVALVDRGLVYLDGNDLDRALADLDQAIRVDPSSEPAYADRGVVEHRRGDYDAAIADESQAIALKPEAAAPWVDRGYAYLGKREYEMALADFADALKLNASDAGAYDGRATADKDKGDDNAAVEDYGRAIAIAPGDEDARESRGALLVARGDGAGAATDFSAASDAHLERRDYGRALDLADKAVGLKPDDPALLNERCWARAVANTSLDGALADCQRSLALRPNSAETLDSLAFVYFRQGQWDASIKGYSAALDQNAQLPSSLFMRGVAKLRRDDAEGGQADIQSAKTFDANVATQFAGYGVTP